MILDRIVAKTRETVGAAKAECSYAGLERTIPSAPPARDFAAALEKPGVSLIAEVKKASPSRGLLAPDFDPVSLASIYTRCGASAISVLTDEPFFQGKLAYLRDIRTTLGKDCPPLLRKDFVVDPYQVLEARSYGADAVLLIAAILDERQLAELQLLATELGMSALVEAHDEAEINKALAVGAQIVGINNRDLRSFHVDLATTERLRATVPESVTLVSESGFRQPDDIRRAARAGVDAVLIGEALVTAPDVATQVQQLVQAGLEGHPDA